MLKKRHKTIVIKCYQVTLITCDNEVLDYYVRIENFDSFLHRTHDSTCIVHDVVWMSLPYRNFTEDLCHHIDYDSNVVFF